MSNKVNWKVLVYMAGDNNLSAEMVYGLKEMRRIAATKKFKEQATLVAQFDPRGGTPRVFSFESADPEDDGDLGIFGKELNGDHIGAIINALPKSEKGRGVLEGLLPLLKPNQFGFEEIKVAFASAYAKTHLATLETAFERFRSIVTENSAAPEVVQGFLESHVKRHGQEHLMVVLSGHGSGSVGDFLKDDQAQSSLGIPKLRAILESVCKGKLADQGIHILGMDSCLMSMAEIAFEISKSTRFLVGAEGFVPNTGWPYHRVLEAILDHPAAKKKPGEPEEPEEQSVARAIVKAYSRYYRDYEVAGLSTDLAACDLRNLRPLIDEFAGLTKVLLEDIGDVEKLTPGDSPVLDAILPAHQQVQSYKNEQYIDLWDFCDRLAANLSDQGKTSDDVRRLCSNIKALIEGGQYTPKQGDAKPVEHPVVVKSCRTGAKFQHSHGLSIYFPWSASDFVPAYRNLRFAGEEGTRWGEFLEKYLNATRRARRDQDRNLDGKKAKPPLHFGEPGDIVAVKFGTDDRAKFGTDDRAKFGTDDRAKFGTDDRAKFGTDDRAKGLNVASTMKNSPDGFYGSDC